ncbi:MRP20 [Candida jiufengensis]|uniref:MRP20 n=1 Tax=Candida jiufengensis TaxID=497108 RepID=UPI0022255D02|nr:MRP20 [Candida jiufengensis]KAI5955746.1 MRP20 [Candida jiufengensis]
MSSITRISIRSVHHKLTPSTYPKVQSSKVELNPPKYGFRKIRPPILAQSPTKTLFPNSELAKLYIENGKPIPNRFMSQIDSQRAHEEFEKFQENLSLDEPHFTKGKNKVYLPGGRICLLRPNAKHTPYQAKFLVPKSMNKMDLRDYLWNIYGLRALNVTVQLQPATWKRGPQDLARYRIPQLKKMTIDMAEPFVWPEVSQIKIKELKQQMDESEKIVKHNIADGSDKNKTLDVYDGMFKGDTKPKRYIPKQILKSNYNSVKEINKGLNSNDKRSQVASYLGL